MRVKETKVYQFDELSDDAKERARQWYREVSSDDTFWHENVIDDAKECFKLVGIRIDRTLFSGFSSQGDGACFEGSWYASDFKAGKLEEHAPVDKELHRIAKEFASIVAECPHASFSVKHRGHYQHEHCTEFNVDLGLEENEDGDLPEVSVTEDDIIELARDCMRWIYQTLEKEYDWQNADTQVDENIRANEYEFDETGERT